MTQAEDIADQLSLDESAVYGRSPLKMKIAGMVLIALLSAGALLAWLAYLSAITTQQPLQITACTPASYATPADGIEGPPQAECERWFHRRASWLAGDPIPVTGQVCNRGDETVAYQVQVALESVDSPGVRLLLIDLKLTYAPGCTLPYFVPFDIPDLLASAEDGEDLGAWRLVGTAEPFNRSKYEVYVWSVTGTMDLVGGSSST